MSGRKVPRKAKRRKQSTRHPVSCAVMGCAALSTQAMLSRLALEFPALTEFGVDELLGLAVTAWLESLGIPVESAPGAPGRIG